MLDLGMSFAISSLHFILVFIWQKSGDYSRLGNIYVLCEDDCSHLIFHVKNDNM